MKIKKILITNDDGYESEGLLALADAVRGLGQVSIVAPASEKSACGHSLTLTRPLRFVRAGDDFYKLDDGTPSDCVYLALNSMFEEATLKDNEIKIFQNAKISRGYWDKQTKIDCELLVGDGVFLFVVGGIARIGEKMLFERDSVQITDTKQIEIELFKDTEILIVEV